MVQIKEREHVPMRRRSARVSRSEESLDHNVLYTSVKVDHHVGPGCSHPSAGSLGLLGVDPRGRRHQPVAPAMDILTGCQVASRVRFGSFTRT